MDTFIDSSLSASRFPLRKPLLNFIREAARQTLHGVFFFLAVFIFHSSLRAGTSGDFYFQSNGSSISITGYLGGGGAVTIPSTIDGLPVTSIGNKAFLNNASITSVAFPGSIISIGDEAFRGCNLTDLSLPNSVTSIGAAAFLSSHNLTNVSVSSGVTSIGAFAFRDCPKLNQIGVALENPSYASQDGVLFDHSLTKLILYPVAKSQTTYTIPSSVTSIEFNAFESCTSLTSVTIPSGVTSIGNNAFTGSWGLTNVTIPSGVSHIGDGTFSGCWSLTSVAIPSGVTSIGDSAFNGCTNLTEVTISEGVTFIGNGAFKGCNLNNVTIPNSLTSIGNLAFAGNKLTSVTIPGGVTSIGLQAFFDCPRLTQIDVSPDNANYASQSGVLFNKALHALLQYPAGNARTTYNIPDSVTYIDENAFNVCTYLAQINVSPANANYASQDGVLFSKALDQLLRYPIGNTQASYTIPNSVTFIAGFAFQYGTNLTTVTVPGSVTSIGYRAFYNCSNLSSAGFWGNAPGTIEDVFENVGPDFTIYRTLNATGFSSPMWLGHPTVAKTFADPMIYSGPKNSSVSVGATVSLSVSAYCSGALTVQWYKDTVAIEGATSLTYTIPSAAKSDAAGYSVTVSGQNGSVSSAKAYLSVLAPQASPAIVSQPLSTTKSPGSSIVLSVECLRDSSSSIVSAARATVLPPASALGTSNTTYQWYRNGVAISGETAASITIASASASDEGVYTVTVTNASGTTTSRPATVTVADPVSGEIVNGSIRALCTSSAPLILGFVTTGGTKSYLVRAAGPSLAAFQVDNALADPALQMYTGSTPGLANDNWADGGLATSLEAAFHNVGAFSFVGTSSKDAAILADVDGARTVQISPASGNPSGVVLVECYDAGTGIGSHLVNLSTRNYAGEGVNSLIAGFVINGNVPKKVLVRAIGPGLALFNITDYMKNPKIEVILSKEGVNSSYGTNDNWNDEPDALATFDVTGAFRLPADSKDAAVVVTLTPGTYTAVVTAPSGDSGQALVEVYEVP